jgi:signal transduction histidine kinase
MLGSHKLTALLLWILLTVMLLGLLVQLDLSGLSRHQSALLVNLEQRLNQRLSKTEQLLHYMAILTARSSHDLSGLSQTLEELLPLSPVIHRLHLQQLVTEDEIYAFERQMRLKYPDFLLHGLSAITPANTETSGAVIYQPVILALPAGQSDLPPLGTDLSLIPALKTAIATARNQSLIAYSDVFNQARGEPLIAAFLAVPQDPTLLLSVALRGRDLLDTEMLPPGSRVSLTLPQNSPQTLWQSTTPEAVLFYLPRQQTVGNKHLQLSLLLEYPVRLADFSWGLVLITLVLNTSGSLLFYAWLRQRQAATISYLETLEIQRLKQHLQTHSEELQQQLQENQQLTHRILDIQERERRHLAQELHDELGQCLTAIRTDARMLLQDHPDSSDSVNHHAESIDAIARHIYDVTYDLMRALRPTLLDDLGLVDAVRELIRSQHLERQGVQLELTLKGALNDMEERLNINLYRMIQEALTNIQRHASCTEVQIRLQRSDADEPSDRLELEVRDNGCGFDPSIISRKGRFGMLGMQARAKALGGDLTINSQPGDGTLLRLRIPLSQAEVRAASTPSAAG